jgi:hypothetical protein
MLERCCRFHDDVVQSIGLLFPDPLRADRDSVANPQLKLQLGEQTLEPSGMSAGFLPTRTLMPPVLRSW